VLDAARGGDRDALETLVTTHYDRVHALCRRMLGNEADALDATQDALVAAIRAIGRFDGRSSFGTWLYRIATNTCIDEIRRRRRRPVTGIAADVAEVADEFAFGGPALFVVSTPRVAAPFDASQAEGDGSHEAVGAGGTGGGGGAGDAGDSGGAGGAGGGRGSARSGRTGDGAPSARDPADIVAARVDIDAALKSLPVEFRTAVVLRDVCDLPYDEISEILGVPVGTVRSRIARARTALATTWQTDTAEPGVVSPRGPQDTTGNDSGPPDVKARGRARTRVAGASRPLQPRQRDPESRRPDPDPTQEDEPTP
jgi:RNA polymerase sigma-70 factor, ECF subfamily